MKTSRPLCAIILCVLALFALIFFFVLAFPNIAFADNENPVVFVKSVVDECLYILKSEKNKDLQAEKILDLMKTSFDFPAITESLLRGLEVSDKDKLAFTDIFPKLLQMRYRIFVKSPDSLVVEYSRYEVFVGEMKAVVYTLTKIPGHDLDLNYKLRHNNGDWKIYDITVGGVSLVDNYRAQIYKVLSRSSFADFMAHLEGMVGKKTSAVNN